MSRKEEMASYAQKLMNNTKNIRNIGIVAHIDHGKSTLSDNLIAACGLMSQELAGQQRVMDFEDQEQNRGITINSANITMGFKTEGQEYLINLIDTPGHVDFTGEVIRAMRAVDGVVLVVDAVEGIMPQTETVLRQALKENVKPVLFVNKVDRLFNELKVTEEDMQQRFIKVITKVNELIARNAPDEFKKEWLVNPANGTVCFGSAYYNWAVSVPHMQKTGINFKQVYSYCNSDNQKELAQKSKIHEALLEMVIKHLPSPITAQKYRIPVIWKGELESEIGKSMSTTNSDGELSMMVTDVTVSDYAGDIATGRIYSGKIKKGMKVNLLGSKKEANIQSVGLFMGADYVEVSEIGAGNIAAMKGLKEVYAGETISTLSDMVEFESFLSAVEPVITISIEPKETKDLPKLIEAIKQLTKEDPNLQATINPDTGEHLLSGMGELHLEVNVYRIETNHKIKVNTSPPIVVFNETITKESPQVEGKTPNKHNKFLIKVEPIPVEILHKMIQTKFPKKIKPNDKVMIQKFVELGFDRNDSKKIWAVKNNCVLMDKTRGIEALHEVKELLIQGFEDATTSGPLAKEKCFGIIVKILDATLHEDAIHRGPSQVLPAITRAIYACIMQADPVLFEPKQNLTITVPEEFMGAVSKELGSRRTQIQEIRQEGDSSIFIAKAPVKELIGFSQDMRGATQGRAVWTAEYSGYELLPRELQEKVIGEIRQRKGLNPTPKPASYYFD